MIDMFGLIASGRLVSTNWEQVNNGQDTAREIQQGLSLKLLVENGRNPPTFFIFNWRGK